MTAILGQLVCTCFPEVGLKTIASTQVPAEILQAFIQQVVYQHWDSYNPPQFGYRAAYIHQIAPEHSLFGWLYNDEVDDLGRSHVPYFICYYIAERLHAVLLENIFTCLHKGPVALINRQHLPPATLENIVAPDLWSYQPASLGVAIPSIIRDRSQVVLQQRKLLELFVSVNEGEMIIKLNKQIYKQQQALTQPSIIVTPVPRSQSLREETISIWQDNLSRPQVCDRTSAASVPTSTHKSILLVGITTGVVSALALIVGSYYLVQLFTPTSQVQQPSFYLNPK